MLDQGVDAAEADRRGDEPYRGDHPVRIAVHLERDHRAAHLRVVDPGDAWIGAQPAAQFGGARGSGPNPHRQGGEPAQQQIPGHGMQHPAGGEADLAQPGRELLVAGDDPAHHIAVPAQIFGGAVEDDPGPVLDGPLQDGGGEGVVDEQRHRAAGVGERADVDLGERRVRRRLDHHQTCVRTDGSRDARRIGPGDFGAQQSGTEEVVAAAVERADGDHMAQPHARAGQQDGGERRHSTGERHGTRGPFEPGECRLESGRGRVVEPGVDGRPVEPGTGGGEGVDPFRLSPGVVRGVGGGQIDRRGVQAECSEVVASGVHCFGGQRPGPGCRRGQRRGFGVHDTTLNSPRTGMVKCRATFDE